MEALFDVVRQKQRCESSTETSKLAVGKGLVKWLGSLYLQVEQLVETANPKKGKHMSP